MCVLSSDDHLDLFFPGSLPLWSYHYVASSFSKRAEFGAGEEHLACEVCMRSTPRPLSRAVLSITWSANLPVLSAGYREFLDERVPDGQTYMINRRVYAGDKKM
jgi:hypothetical protein